MLEVLRSLGTYRLALLLLLYAASFLILSVQLIWYSRPMLGAIYYLIFASALAAVTWYGSSARRRSRLVGIAVVAALLIGTIPYEVRLPFVSSLLVPGGIDPNDLSDLTRYLPMSLRVMYEVATFPVIHFLLQCAIAATFRRNRTAGGPGEQRKRLHI